MLVEQRNNKETCYPFKKIYEKPNSTSKKVEISQTSNSNKKKLDETDQLLDLDYANGIFKKENPKFLENFELLESIKAGSSGAVIKVKSKNIRAREKILALKVLPNKREKSQQDLSKKFLEAFIHKKLHNNNIPEVYALYQVGKNYSCMLLEYNKYGDLCNFKKKVIKRECLSESLICYIAGGILNALKYLNKKRFYIWI